MLPRYYFKMPEAVDVDFFPPLETTWKTTCSGFFLFEAIKTNCSLSCSTSIYELHVMQTVGDFSSPTWSFIKKDKEKEK